MPIPFIEPFRIKVVEKLKVTTHEERAVALASAHNNLFAVPAEDVFVDLLTDSGTGAMSDAQWAGIMRGDESYAGARSYAHFESAVQEVTGFLRAANPSGPRGRGHALQTLVKPQIVPNNRH